MRRSNLVNRSEPRAERLIQNLRNSVGQGPLGSVFQPVNLREHSWQCGLQNGLLPRGRRDAVVEGTEGREFRRHDIAAL